MSLEMIDADIDTNIDQAVAYATSCAKDKEIVDNDETKEQKTVDNNEIEEDDDNHRENKSKTVHDISKKVKIVQEKAKAKTMEIVKNIENARSKRRPKPSKKVLENLKDQKKEKDQKNPKYKKKESLEATRQSLRKKNFAPSFDLKISQL
uniref:Uncharacterized protein n=1 Tax=Cucumis sativus TaxID=3659 RepID=A0A0A0LZ92_CUCSA